MQYPRSAGILLHISSLPGPYGIGDLGSTAREFARFLGDSKQTIWQILPLCPPANGNSPYSSYSAFATNANLISPDDLIAAGWGSRTDLESTLDECGFQPADSAEVDFGSARRIRERFFLRAFQSCRTELSRSADFRDFCESNRNWLDDFALFETAGRFFGQFNWTLWPDELANRNPLAVERFRQEQEEGIEYSRFLQFVFDQQWKVLRDCCRERGIRIYGDLPIFVDHQSSDVWANQSQFQLDGKGRPEVVAGVPPDYFSATGQKWGNPLYRWDVMEADGFRWWNNRFARALDQFDIIRVDHFRGFESYYQIPAGAADARRGKWVEGPGRKPFDSAGRLLGDMPVVAEDLGLITEAVDRLRDELGFPTMRVMQFGYSSLADNLHRPSSYPENCFAYTGTHDNETLMGWYQNQLSEGSDETRDLLNSEFDQSDPALPLHFQMIQSVLKSAANTAMIPLQDYLGLGNEARMNLPATAEGNWKWKLRSEKAYEGLTASIRELTERHGR